VYHQFFVFNLKQNLESKLTLGMSCIMLPAMLLITKYTRTSM